MDTVSDIVNIRTKNNKNLFISNLLYKFMRIRHEIFDIYIILFLVKK